MFRTRPPSYAIACVFIWSMQFGSTAFVFRELWAANESSGRWWGLSALGASLVLGVLLTMQLPRALQWRPRLNSRPSPQVRAERERIARDLHDGVGSQLVCAMALLNASATRDSHVLLILEKSMLDLRLLVDSMNGTNEPFFDRLAKLRHRMYSALERRGIRMVWDVCLSSPLSETNPDTATHILGILQEALSNVLQHAQATEVTVKVQYICTSGAWYAEVSDNGRGMPASEGEATLSSGNGVASMYRRANLAGGQLSMTRRDDGGTRLSALIPGHKIGESRRRDPDSPGGVNEVATPRSPGCVDGMKHASVGGDMRQGIYRSGR